MALRFTFRFTVGIIEHEDLKCLGFKKLFVADH